MLQGICWNGIVINECGNFCAGHELQYDENAVLPRPEDERVTQAEKNQMLVKQLKVCCVTSRLELCRKFTL